MTTPAYLKPGDKIGLVAPSRKIDIGEPDKAIAVIESFKFRTIPGLNLNKTQNQFAGSDQERAADIQKFLDDPEIKAIICARGGYGAIRTLDHLNFTAFAKNPKWIVGYSDITVFHSYINAKLNVETLHALMPFNFVKDDADSESMQKTFEILSGNIPEYRFESNVLNRNGIASGELTGGNLSVLYSLRGTPADIDLKNKILFIEDLDEYLYHIDRMMMNFKYGNKLSGLKGVIVGDMSDMKDNAVPFGKTAYEIITDVLSGLNIPVCFGFPAGHGNKNLPLILGREVRLEAGKSCSLIFV
jgi:muramoyltetrapeptide carboxypeptidase